MDNLISVLLTGGKSSRMGRDKGLLIWDNKKWVEIAYNKIKQINNKPFISINTSQVEKYEQLFDKDDLILDYLDIPGPLGALFGIHRKFPDSDLLVLACDMVLMQSKYLHNLLEAYIKSRDYHCYLYNNNDFIEPLCAIYTSSALDKMLGLFEKSEENKFKYSFKQYIDRLNSYKINLNPLDQKFFTNFNNQENLKLLEQEYK